MQSDILVRKIFPSESCTRYEGKGMTSLKGLIVDTKEFEMEGSLVFL